jgi:hypothetical protein
MIAGLHPVISIDLASSMLAERRRGDRDRTQLVAAARRRVARTR